MREEANFQRRKSSFRNWFSSITQRVTEASYQIIGGITLDGSHYREDIGFRAISG